MPPICPLAIEFATPLWLLIAFLAFLLFVGLLIVTGESWEIRGWFVRVRWQRRRSR